MISHIRENSERIIKSLPEKVRLVAAAKTRTPGEIMEAISGGVKIIGENYVQEAREAYRVIGRQVEWHFIGHLQKNKVKKAVEIFDMIETVDSADIAEEISKRCEALDKVMPILIEINSGREKNKFGVLPEDAEKFIGDIKSLSNIKITGLMTMGPVSADQEEARPYFTETRKVFERIERSGFYGVEMKYLSMGMTNSYKVAIEEGANIVRIGTSIFGNRE